MSNSLSLLCESMEQLLIEFGQYAEGAAQIEEQLRARVERLEAANRDLTSRLRDQAESFERLTEANKIKYEDQRAKLKKAKEEKGELEKERERMSTEINA